MKNVIFILLLFCGCTICNAQSCYKETRAKGVSLYNQKKYKEAINVFEAAKDCPDKPAAHDLNAMIKNCRDAISAQEENTKRQRAAAPAPNRVSLNILRVDFSNSNDGKIIDDWGAVLYASKIRYMYSRATYNSSSSATQEVEFHIKIYKPDGTLMKGSSSPAGYTYSHTASIRPGNKNTVELSGWGNKNGGTYSAGKYLYELWYKGKKLYETAITLFEQR